MVDMDPISFYHGLKVERNCIKKILKSSQSAYIDKILAKYYLNQAKPWNVSMKKGILLPNERLEASQAEQEWYWEMTRCLMFFMVETRPDIAFIISIISLFAKNHPHQYTKIVKTIMRYLKAIKSIRIPYDKEKKEKRDLTIKEYSNSD